MVCGAKEHPRAPGKVSDLDVQVKAKDTDRADDVGGTHLRASIIAIRQSVPSNIIGQFTDAVTGLGSDEEKANLVTATIPGFVSPLYGHDYFIAS